MYRPGHFRGVATVCKRLIWSSPTAPILAKRNAQQLAIVEALAADLNMPIAIVPVPTVRESDGLAIKLAERCASIAAEAERDGFCIARCAPPPPVSRTAPVLRCQEAALNVMRESRRFEWSIWRCRSRIDRPVDAIADRSGSGLPSGPVKPSIDNVLHK